MDTDGTWNKIRNQGVFSTNHKHLAHEVAELISTLGWKPRIWELQKTGFGKTITAYDVTFIPFDDNPFRLSRKADLVRTGGTTRSRRRFIKSIEPTLTVPTRCITVDSPTHSYLCTEAMIPTHNCVGTPQLRKYRKDPGLTYKTQVYLYGRGFENMGLPVKRVAIAFVPRGATLHSLHVWHADYDPKVADWALARREQVIGLLDDLQVENNPDRYKWIPATQENCRWCSQYAHDPTSGLQCRGDGS